MYALGLDVIDHLKNTHNKGQVILELGSGFGSFVLSEWFDVYCIEHNKKWMYKYDNIIYYYAPLKNNWYDITFELPNYNILIIDGPPGSYSRGFIQKDLFNWNKTIVIDDVHRLNELALADWVIKQGDRTFIQINRTIIIS